MENTARDVLKLYIENLDLRAYEVLASVVSVFASLLCLSDDRRISEGIFEC